MHRIERLHDELGRPAADRRPRIEYLELFLSRQVIAPGEPLNVMFVVRNPSDQPVSQELKVYLQRADLEEGESPWLLGASAPHKLEGGEIRHVYLSIDPCWMTSGENGLIEPSEFVVYAGDSIPQNRKTPGAVTDIFNIVGPSVYLPKRM